MVNHDWIFAGNQFKKTFNELLFTRWKWVENRSCCFAYFAYCVCERCLDYGRFKFTKEKSDLSFLSVWEVCDVGVLQAFVLDCRQVEPINIVCCQFWFLFLGFRLRAMVNIIEDESFVDIQNRWRHRRRLRYSRHWQWRRHQQKLRRRTRGHRQRGEFWFLFLGFCLRLMVNIIKDESFVDIRNPQRRRQRLWYSRHRRWKRRRQKLRRQTRRHRRRGGTQRRRLNLQRTNARRQNLFLFVVFNTDLPTVAFLRGGLWIFTMVAIMLIDMSFKKFDGE